MKIMIALILIIPSLLHAKLPAGWRTPESQELGSDINWRKEDPNRYLSVSGDFDGDQREDFAQLLVNDSKNSMALFVFSAPKNLNPSYWIKIPTKDL